MLQQSMKKTKNELERKNDAVILHKQNTDDQQILKSYLPCLLLLKLTCAPLIGRWAVSVYMATSFFPETKFLLLKDKNKF